MPESFIKHLIVRQVAGLSTIEGWVDDGPDGSVAREVEKKSGKCKSPTLDIDGQILADASVEDVAEHLEKLGWKI